MKRAVLIGVLCALLAVLIGTRLAERSNKTESTRSDRMVEARGPSPYKRPFNAAATQYYRLLLQEKFSELDAAIEVAQRDNATLSDGQPRIAAIYGGIEGCVSYACDERLSESQWQQRERLLQEWRRVSPGSTAAEIALAAYHVEHAWDLRGSGWSSKVRPEAWRRFGEEMDIAEKELMKVSERAKQDPQWSLSMLNVGLAKHWPLAQYAAFFHHAVDEHPDSMMLYMEGCGYYAPRWYGTSEELRDCIEDAVSRTKETLGDTLYARINWSLHVDDMFTNGQASWEQVRSGFERMIADYPDPWNLNKFANFACLAEDAQTMAQLGKQIGTEPIAEAWNGSPDLFRYCVYMADQVLRQAR